MNGEDVGAVDEQVGMLRDVEVNQGDCLAIAMLAGCFGVPGKRARSIGAGDPDSVEKGGETIVVFHL